MLVEIWSDVNCPWCAIGRARFNAAVADLDWHDELEVVWRPFELDPSAPAGGTDLREAIARKYGRTPEQVDAMQQGLVTLGAEVGVDFDWEKVRRRNTFDAHRLLAWALAEGGAEVQDALQGRLLRAHFAEGLAVDDHAVLVRLAGDVGLDPVEATDVLAGDRFGDVVRDDERRARQLEITAVPTFVLGGRFAIPGAQDPETIRAHLERARDRLAAEH